MPLGGFYVQQGQLELLPVVLAGLLGTVSVIDSSAQSLRVVFSARTPMRPGFFYEEGLRIGTRHDLATLVESVVQPGSGSIGAASVVGGVCCRRDDALAAASRR